MIKDATIVLNRIGPLLVAMDRQKLEGKSQKEIASAVNRSESWVSRRVQEATYHGIIEMREDYRWGRHKKYGGFAKWVVNTLWFTHNGKKTVDTLLALDPILEQCPLCQEVLDVIGFSGYIACPFCGTEFIVEGVEPTFPWSTLLLVAVPLAIGGVLTQASSKIK